MEWIVLGIILGVVGLLFVFVRFTTVDEGTAKAVMVFGKFSKIISQWGDHWMDTEWNIWKEKKKGEEPEEGSKGKKRKKARGRIIGGLWVYFWPFQKIHRYKHRWTDIRLRDSKMEVEFHEKEDFGHVLLKPAVYAFKLTAVETKPPERIPVDVLVLVTLRVQNPYLFLFVAPPTPVEDILARISAETRALITSSLIDDLLQLKGESFWGLIRKAKVIEDTLQKWGVKLAEKGIEIQEINLPLEYQKAAAAEQQQTFQASGTAAQTMGAVVAMIATITKKPKQKTTKRIEEVQKEFADNPDTAFRRYENLIKANVDFIQRKMGLDAGAVRQYYFQGGSEATNLIALLGDVLRGGGSGKVSDGQGSPVGQIDDGSWRKKEPRDMTQEQRNQIWEEKFGKGSGKPQNP